MRVSGGSCLGGNAAVEIGVEILDKYNGKIYNAIKSSIIRAR
jgi:hypothetical protein